MPKSTPGRSGKPGQNRDSRDGVFGHLESQVGPLPRVGLYARVSTPHQHTIGMQLRQLREFQARRRWQEVLDVEEVVSGIQAAPGERPSTRRCAAPRDRHHRGVAAGSVGPFAQRPDAHSPRTPRARTRSQPMASTIQIWRTQSEKLLCIRLPILVSSYRASPRGFLPSCLRSLG